MVEFVIAVRTYDRPVEFVEKTYKMLSKQVGLDLANRLYVFVASEKEKDRYTEALEGLEYKAIVVGRLGLKEVTEFISDYFPIGQNILFLDDDHLGFFEFQAMDGSSPNLKATNMLEYLIDAFQTLDTFGISGFIFRNTNNGLWIKKSPFKEIKPFFFYGGCFGIKNNPDLVKTTTSQCEDCERTANILEKEGSVLVYNWAGIVFKKGKDYGANEGGMKSSGDRNSEANQTVLNLYNNHPFVAKYFEEPFLNDAVGVLDMKLRRLKYNRKRPKWHTYFEPDKNQVI